MKIDEEIKNNWIYKFWEQYYDFENSNRETLIALQGAFLRGAAMITEIIQKSPEEKDT